MSARFVLEQAINCKAAQPHGTNRLRSDHHSTTVGDMRRGTAQGHCGARAKSRMLISLYDIMIAVVVGIWVKPFDAAGFCSSLAACFESSQVIWVALRRGKALGICRHAEQICILRCAGSGTPCLSSFGTFVNREFWAHRPISGLCPPK